MPAAARGTTRNGYIHAADWYPTFCGLAGGDDCLDQAISARRNVPAVDGHDMWPYLAGSGGAGAASPRTEIMVAACETPKQHGIPLSRLSPNCSGALIRGDHKLVLGEQFYGFWQGPLYPNVTTNHSAFDEFVDCGRGCVFNIATDPGETVDLAVSQPDLLESLRARFFELNATQFNAPMLGANAQMCKAYTAAHGGFLGPYFQQ